VEYKIQVELTDKPIDKSNNPLDKEKVATDKNEKKKKKETNSEYNDMLKSVAKVTAIYGVAQSIATQAVNTVSQRYTLQGETLKAQRLNTSYSNATQNIQMGLGIGFTLLTGNPLGIAMSALQIAQRAYQLSLEQQRYNIEQARSMYRTNYLSQRLVRDISEVR
jgi:hypothetical protein